MFEAAGGVARAVVVGRPLTKPAAGRPRSPVRGRPTAGSRAAWDSSFAVHPGRGRRKSSSIVHLPGGPTTTMLRPRARDRFLRDVARHPRRPLIWTPATERSARGMQRASGLRPRPGLPGRRSLTSLGSRRPAALHTVDLATGESRSTSLALSETTGTSRCTTSRRSPRIGTIPHARVGLTRPDQCLTNEPGDVRELRYHEQRGPATQRARSSARASGENSNSV